MPRGRWPAPRRRGGARRRERYRAEDDGGAPMNDLVGATEALLGAVRGDSGAGGASGGKGGRERDSVGGSSRPRSRQQRGREGAASGSAVAAVRSRNLRSAGGRRRRGQAHSGGDRDDYDDRDRDRDRDAGGGGGERRRRRRRGKSSVKSKQWRKDELADFFGAAPSDGAEAQGDAAGSGPGLEDDDIDLLAKAMNELERETTSQARKLAKQARKQQREARRQARRQGSTSSQKDVTWSAAGVEELATSLGITGDDNIGADDLAAITKAMNSLEMEIGSPGGQKKFLPLSVKLTFKPVDIMAVIADEDEEEDEDDATGDEGPLPSCPVLHTTEEIEAIKQLKDAGLLEDDVAETAHAQAALLASEADTDEEPVAQPSDAGASVGGAKVDAAPTQAGGSRAHPPQSPLRVPQGSTPATAGRDAGSAAATPTVSPMKHGATTASSASPASTRSPDAVTASDEAMASPAPGPRAPGAASPEAAPQSPVNDGGGASEPVPSAASLSASQRAVLDEAVAGAGRASATLDPASRSEDNHLRAEATRLLTEHQIDVASLTDRLTRERERQKSRAEARVRAKLSRRKQQQRHFAAVAALQTHPLASPGPARQLSSIAQARPLVKRPSSRGAVPSGNLVVLNDDGPAGRRTERRTERRSPAKEVTASPIRVREPDAGVYEASAGDAPVASPSCEDDIAEEHPTVDVTDETSARADGRQAPEESGSGASPREDPASEPLARGVQSAGRFDDALPAADEGIAEAIDVDAILNHAQEVRLGGSSRSGQLSPIRVPVSQPRSSPPRAADAPAALPSTVPQSRRGMEPFRLRGGKSKDRRQPSSPKSRTAAPLSAPSSTGPFGLDREKQGVAFDVSNAPPLRPAVGW